MKRIGRCTGCNRERYQILPMVDGRALCMLCRIAHVPPDDPTSEELAVLEHRMSPADVRQAHVNGQFAAKIHGNSQWWPPEPVDPAPGYKPLPCISSY